MAAVLAAGLCLVAVTACGHDDAKSPGIAVVSADTKPTYSFVVAKGTNEIISHGGDVQIVPNPLIMKVGDVIRIDNQDTVGYTVGPFYVGAGQVMTQVATQPGSYKGLCLLHSGEELVVRIEAR